MKIFKKLVEKYWRIKYGEDIDIVYPEDLVDVETTGLKYYHRHGSIKDKWWIERLGIITMTRREAEERGYLPCEECFGKVLPEIRRR